MASQDKITVYNLADLKNTTDDAIPNYLASLKFTPSHLLTDVRLTLGFSAFALSAACFAWDYKLGFESTKHYTAFAVALYTILNGFLTFWIFYVEKGTIYQGTSPNGDKIRISTETKKNVPVYHMTVEVKDGKTGEKKTLKISRSFTEWFDATGRFVAAPLQTVLAQGVDVIGKVDTKRAAPAAAKTEGEPGPAAAVYTPEMLDMLSGAGVSVVGSAAETATGTETTEAKKAGKRRTN
ncbi:microsomal signal peptidase 25 kDa subunit-domain-containing protein [Triangularia verruculosa]|uniref:Signal peptidase complex subunit 2 n=1 Tax=Triangularia verruculosa TaxID=2587418 RepID=A0AAN6XG32_9PEZI|nr:microsomal signal peptidase 25 kDa subunit-domain-containing protein [Triangularia verruculosa]